MNAFAAILFASLLSRLGYQMARSPVLPTFAANLGALPEFIGVIVAASTVTGVFFKLPSGALSDVLGRKRMMVLGALFFALPPFLYPFVGDPWSLLTLRFVHGFATAVFSPVAAAYVASLAETGRGARLGWFSSGNDIGATAGPLIGGFVLYFSASYAVTYLLVGAIGVLTLLPRLAVLPLDPRQEVAQGGVVRGVARQHLVGQRQPLRGHHQGDDDLHAVRPVIARIAVASLVAFGKRRIGLEIGAGQIVEQHIEADVEQVAPAPDQMIEQGLLVFEQPVVTAIQLVDFGQPEVFAEQIGLGTALKPFAMQPPLAAARQQPVGRQQQQHAVPPRALAAR